MFWIDANFDKTGLLTPDKSERVISFDVTQLVPDYDTPDTVPEWAWIQRNASYSHPENGKPGGVWEFILNLSNEFTDIPKTLESTIKQARQDGVSYILYHQGT